ncbi:MAG: tail fiber domain-containing protein [Xanthobacteraceae bacterium]
MNFQAQHRRGRLKQSQPRPTFPKSQAPGLLTSTNTYDLGILGRYAVTSAGEVLNLGGAYVQSLEAGALSVGTLNVNQTSTFLNGLEAFGGLNVGAPGFYSSGPVGITSEGGASNILSVTAATTSQSTGKTTAFSAESITNNATSSTASIIKSDLNIISQGSWTGTGASNIGLYVSSVTGGTNNYDAIFNGGGNVGVGTSTPYSRLQVTGPNTASTSAFAVVNSASTTVFSVFDNGNSTYSGSIFQSSDQRLKTDVQTLDSSSSLSALEALNPVSYLRIDQPGTGENLGFIAQQVQEIFPQLVSTTSATALTPDGTLTLNYEGLISPIVSAI